MIKGYIAESDFQRRNLNQKLATVTDATQNNHLIAQINILDSQIKEAEQAKEDNEKKLSGLGEQTREAYVTAGAGPVGQGRRGHQAVRGPGRRRGSEGRPGGRQGQARAQRGVHRRPPTGSR